MSISQVSRYISKSSMWSTSNLIISSSLRCTNSIASSWLRTAATTNNTTSTTVRSYTSLSHQKQSSSKNWNTNGSLFVTKQNNLLAASHLFRTPVRCYNLHEYQSMNLFAKYNVEHPRCFVANNAHEAEEAARKLGGMDVVVKAQVLAGGRGKGHFVNGFTGGVRVCTSPEEARDVTSKMIGSRLVTKQTSSDGKPVNQVLITERLFLRRETYFAILLDRAHDGPVMVASPAGGMDIETVARDTPHLIFKEPIDIHKGVSQDQLEALAQKMGFKGKQLTYAVQSMQNLYKLFIENDCTLVEINPFAETHDGRVLCLDAKLNFDDNADFRHHDLTQLVDESQLDPREVRASKVGFNFIALDGDIGCLVNGAGLAMATMDAIKLHGGNPANFLDLGGGASDLHVSEALKLLNEDRSVKSILVNIFGGIVRCDMIALGLIRAVTGTGLKKPLVIRLAGTNVDEAKKLIEESGLRMIASSDLNNAAQKAVRISEIVRMAEDAQVLVSFELPI